MTMTNPYAPPRAVVADVRDPSVASEAAGRGVRLGATLLDGVIFGAMVYLPMIPLIVISASTTAPGDSAVTAMGASILLALVGFGAWAWLTIKYVKANGQSIAKKMLGIKVIRTDGSSISLGRLFWLRNVVNSALGIIPLYGLIDALLIFGEARQCVHDKIADTIVVIA